MPVLFFCCVACLTKVACRPPFLIQLALNKDLEQLYAACLGSGLCAWFARSACPADSLTPEQIEAPTGKHATQPTFWNLQLASSEASKKQVARTVVPAMFSPEVALGKAGGKASGAKTLPVWAATILYWGGGFQRHSSCAPIDAREYNTQYVSYHAILLCVLERHLSA